MHNRAERRETKERKWISKLKKVFNSGYRTIIMPIKQSTWGNFKIAKTYDELKKDKYGVLLKKTHMVCSSKYLDIQEERKRNLNNRKLTKEDQEELDDYLADIHNSVDFDKE